MLKSMLMSLFLPMMLLFSLFIPSLYSHEIVEYLPSIDSRKFVSRTELKKLLGNVIVDDFDQIMLKKCMVCTCCPRGHDGSHKFCKPFKCCYNVGCGKGGSNCALIPLSCDCRGKC